ncbi:hypothetical protein L596_010425 [Steinernema carpocapsae]|uniref:Uncharacterized protein n=1 Tax=Steinernema carpocapsae TaxID=34508 RepID=A0A4U5PIJ1_STECR|nr:hypothetical protein L596_010425 [Steinernema carpocapsae]
MKGASKDPNRLCVFPFPDLPLLLLASFSLVLLCLNSILTVHGSNVHNSSLEIYAVDRQTLDVSSEADSNTKALLAQVTLENQRLDKVNKIKVDQITSFGIFGGILITIVAVIICFFFALDAFLRARSKVSPEEPEKQNLQREYNMEFFTL